MSAEGRIGSFAEAWPYYLREHRQPGTRLVHLVGSTLSLLLLVAAVVSGRRPGTFRYPFWSFAADWKMWALALAGRLRAELRRAGV